MPRGSHVRLTDAEADEKDKIIAGKTYLVRHLGSNEIHGGEGKGKGCTDEAIRETYSRYISKSTVKHLERRNLFVSANCVSLIAPSESALIFRYKTVNITFCNTSEEYSNAFAFVVKDGQNSSLRAHVFHCENSTQASDLCVAMHEAFTVRSLQYQSKCMDRAGWSTGLLLSQREQDEIHLSSKKQNGETYARQITPNVEERSDSNNNFGKTSCNDSEWNEAATNGYANGHGITATKNALANGDKHRIKPANQTAKSPQTEKSYAQNGVGFPLAKLLLNGGVNRARSQSKPYQKIATNVETSDDDWGGFQSSTSELNEDDEDGFSTLARERSSSVSLLGTN